MNASSEDDQQFSCFSSPVEEVTGEEKQRTGERTAAGDGTVVPSFGRAGGEAPWSGVSIGVSAVVLL